LKRIGLLSDTHHHLPDAVFTHFKECDEIWHAGDIGSVALADQLEHFKPFRGVYGNIDGYELQIRYPEYQYFSIENLNVLMIHIGGYPKRYSARAMALIRAHRPGLFISGHSHIVKVMPDPEFNLLHMNPGACGIEGWHKVQTLIRFSIDQGRITDLELIELGKRGTA